MIIITSPLEQFLVISPLILNSFCFFSNISYGIILTYIFISILLKVSSVGVVRMGFTQSIMQKLFLLVKEICKKNIKIKKQVYIIHLFITFLFILISNIVGLFPYSFSITSHFTVTFFISYSFFFSIIIIGIKKNGWHFFKIFLPVRVPLLISPILICVEVISFFIRPLSLALRLSANMLAGHILLKILSSIAWAMLCSGSGLVIILSIIPILILFLVMLLELAIAFLQAYVFLVLMTIYINDVINI